MPFCECMYAKKGYMFVKDWNDIQKCNMLELDINFLLIYIFCIFCNAPVLLWYSFYNYLWNYVLGPVQDSECKPNRHNPCLYGADLYNT